MIRCGWTWTWKHSPPPPQPTRYGNWCAAGSSTMRSSTACRALCNEMKPLADTEVTLPRHKWMRILASLPRTGKMRHAESSLRCVICKALHERWDANGSMEESQALMLTQQEAFLAL